jgi:hypothetical protein
MCPLVITLSESAHFEKCQGDLMPQLPGNYPNIPSAGHVAPALFPTELGGSVTPPSSGPLSEDAIAVAVQKAKDAEKAQNIALRQDKKIQRLAKQAEEQTTRQGSAMAMAEYYAAQLMKDHSTSRDLVLKLKHDKHSSSLTSDLGKAGEALESVILDLKAMSIDLSTDTDNVKIQVAMGQSLVDTMRPLFTRGQSTLNALRKSSAKSVAGSV